jgi:hypothetical protein
MLQFNILKVKQILHMCNRVCVCVCAEEDIWT